MDQTILTLWLWTEGAFSRRVMYQLLMKGLVASPEALLSGQTTNSTLRIIPVKLSVSGNWVYQDAEDLPPADASNPCLRITNGPTQTVEFIYESSSINLYLEEAFPESPMQPQNSLKKAQMMDLINKINIVAMDTNYFLRNSIPEHGFAMGVEVQNREAALNARAWQLKGLLKIQQWAVQYGLTEERGWLTPGIQGPGLVDFTLASNHRFVELMYAIDMMDDEKLGPLSAWYTRFRNLPWWAGFEDRPNIIPDVLKNGKTSRAAWVVDSNP